MMFRRRYAPTRKDVERLAEVVQKVTCEYLMRPRTHAWRLFSAVAEAAGGCLSRRTQTVSTHLPVASSLPALVLDYLGIILAHAVLLDGGL